MSWLWNKTRVFVIKLSTLTSSMNVWSQSTRFVSNTHSALITSWLHPPHTSVISYRVTPTLITETIGDAVKFIGTDLGFLPSKVSAWSIWVTGDTTLLVRAVMRRASSVAWTMALWCNALRPTPHCGAHYARLGSHMLRADPHPLHLNVPPFCQTRLNGNILCACNK